MKFYKIFLQVFEYNNITKRKKKNCTKKNLSHWTCWDIDTCTKTVQNWTRNNISTGPVLLCTGPKPFLGQIGKLIKIPNKQLNKVTH